MSQADTTLVRGGSAPPLKLERVDLDSHPDRDLLRLCSHLGRMRGQVEALERCISAIPAITADGYRMKECTL